VRFDAETIRHLALMLPALLVSLCVHEYAHAWMATKLGDSTPQRNGRLTLSPLSHIDPIGSLLLPTIMILTGAGLLGWAKPVPFNPANFTRKVTMRGGAALTAIAGPSSDVLLAILSALLLRAAVSLDVATVAGDCAGAMVYTFLGSMFVLNIVLAVFNLVPLPPLDGSYLLPRRLDDVRDWLSRYSFILFFALFLLPIPGLGGSIGGLALSPLTDVLTRAVTFIAFLGA